MVRTTSTSEKRVRMGSLGRACLWTVLGLAIMALILAATPGCGGDKGSGASGGGDKADGGKGKVARRDRGGDDDTGSGAAAAPKEKPAKPVAATAGKKAPGRVKGLAAAKEAAPEAPSDTAAQSAAPAAPPRKPGLGTKGAPRGKRARGEDAATAAAPDATALAAVAAVPAAATPALPAAKVAGAKGYDFASLDGIVIENWNFPSGTYLLTPAGVSVVPKDQSGPIAVLQNATIDTAKAGAVAIKISALVNDAPVPIERVRFFWARPDDVKAAEGKWAFAVDRVVVMQQDAASGLWQAPLAGNPKWTGSVERFFVEVRIPDAQWANRAQLRVVLSSVEFPAK